MKKGLLKESNYSCLRAALFRFEIDPTMKQHYILFQQNMHKNDGKHLPSGLWGEQIYGNAKQ